MALAPSRLEPIFSPRPWGVRSLAPLFPEKSNLAEPLGEAWMTGNDCRFATGQFAGQTLGDAWPKMSPDWKGTAAQPAAVFPLLVKFIFADEKLSVQVHPDDAYASRHEAAAGGKGKTEMWYVLSARDGASVLAGLKPSVTRDAFQRAIADGTAEDCLESVPMRPGESIFIPAGTAHTIGAGLVLCEVQQHSDLTYRVYDYNRRDAQGKSRELHIEKALEVMRFGPQTCRKLDPVRVPGAPGKMEGSAAQELRNEILVACPYFATERWQFDAPVAASSSPEHFELLIFLEGQGSIQWKGAEAAYGPAQVWLIPAALGEFRLAPSALSGAGSSPAPLPSAGASEASGGATTLLRTYVPPSLDALSRELTRAGLSPAVTQSLIHR
jgi:mannose-6-phosphate isomerase